MLQENLEPTNEIAKDKMSVYFTLTYQKEKKKKTEPVKASFKTLKKMKTQKNEWIFLLDLFLTFLTLCNQISTHLDGNLNSSLTFTQQSNHSKQHNVDYWFDILMLYI